MQGRRIVGGEASEQGVDDDQDSYDGTRDTRNIDEKSSASIQEAHNTSQGADFETSIDLRIFDLFRQAILDVGQDGNVASGPSSTDNDEAGSDYKGPTHLMVEADERHDPKQIHASKRQRIVKRADNAKVVNLRTLHPL
jgi:hypothetical protein